MPSRKWIPLHFSVAALARWIWISFSIHQFHPPVWRHPQLCRKDQVPCALLHGSGQAQRARRSRTSAEGLIPPQDRHAASFPAESLIVRCCSNCRLARGGRKEGREGEEMQARTNGREDGSGGGGVLAKVKNETSESRNGDGSERGRAKEEGGRHGPRPASSACSSSPFPWLLGRCRRRRLTAHLTPPPVPPPTPALSH